MQEFKVQNCSFSDQQFVDKFLPSMLGKVFHFTSSKNWSQILSSNFLATNQSGEHGNTSIHSQKSLGKHLGAVCLFDLRNQDTKIFAKDAILYDFFMRRWRPEPFYILEVSSKLHSNLVTLESISPDTKKGEMYIPGIESWHLGDLSLIYIDIVYCISIF